MNINNHLNKVYLSFNRLYKELSPGFHLIDNFSSYFSFYTVNHKDKVIFNNQIHSLNKLINNSFSNSENILVIADIDIKNNITTSILYIHSSYNILAKTIYYTTNVTSTEAELFSIRCSIN